MRDRTPSSWLVSVSKKKNHRRVSASAAAQATQPRWVVTARDGRNWTPRGEAPRADVDSSAGSDAASRSASSRPPRVRLLSACAPRPRDRIGSRVPAWRRTASVVVVVAPRLRRRHRRHAQYRRDPDRLAGGWWRALGSDAPACEPGGVSPSLVAAADPVTGLSSTWQYLPLCAGLTVLGLLVALLVFRRRGLRAATRVLAWSLLPLGLGLVGAAKAIWQIVEALVSMVWHVTFSVSGAVGAGLLALSVVLFVVTGAVGSRRLRRANRGSQAVAGTPGTVAGAPRPTATGKALTASAVAGTAVTGTAVTGSAVTRSAVTGSRAPVDERTSPVAAPTRSPARASGTARGVPEDPDMAEVESILRQRGIS